METDEFARLLTSEGFDEVVTVMRQPNGSLGKHAHPFEAKALILDGELRINTAGTERVYQAGQVFHLLSNVSHAESYGPSGVKYLVGRKGSA